MVRKWMVVKEPHKTKIIDRSPSKLRPLFKELKEIIEIPSCPGFEQGISAVLAEKFRPLCDRVYVDHMGNVYGVREGEKDGPVIYCPAHIDSTSYIIESIEPSGYIRFSQMGLEPPYLPYVQRMQIITPKGRIIGVVGSQAGHSHFYYGGAEGKFYPKERTTIPMMDEMFVDIGADTREEALKMGVTPGQQMVYDRDLQWLGDGSTGCVTCKAFDDKVGVQALIETLKQLKGKKLYSTIYMVGTVQEEIGLRGAHASAGLVDPDICIGVDGTIAEAGPMTDSGIGVGRSPNITFSEVPSTLGKGVWISINDIIWGIAAGLVGNQKMNDFAIKIAEKRGIKYEIEGNMPYITSDPAAAQYIAPSITLKIPIRYTHGPVEVCSLYDVVETSKLLTAFIEEIKGIDLSYIDIPEGKAKHIRRRERP